MTYSPIRRICRLIMPLCLTAMLCMIIAVPAETGARRLRLSHKAPPAAKSADLMRPRSEKLDSLWVAQYADSISFAGFDKTASSVKETFYIVNSSPLPICWVRVRLTYTDLSGRMLHRREERIDVDLPQGETRMVAIPSFDLQKSLYYFKSRPPRQGGMPFSVGIEILEAGRPL